MCDYTETMMYSIYTIVDQHTGIYRPEDVLCRLKTEKRYGVYKALGNRSVSSYIASRIKHGDMALTDEGKIVLTEKGKSFLKILQRIVDKDKPYWLKEDDYLNPEQSIACA